MARVPVTEVFFKNSVPPTLKRQYEVFLYKRGTSEKAPIFTAESGGEERAQPLITDVEGRVRTNLGGTPWVAEGRYVWKNTDNEELLPVNLPEGVSGGGGGGSVTSVNGQTGEVVLTAASVGADVSGAAAERLAKASNLSDLTNASTARANLGLGTAAVKASTEFDAAGAAAAAQAASQPLNSSLTSISSNGTSSLGLELLKAASAAAARTALGLGTAATEAASSFLSSAAGAVGATNLATNAVEAAKIKAEAVTTEKLANLAVTAAKLAAESVEEGKIKASAVSEGKLAATSVSNAKIVAGTIAEEKLATAVKEKLTRTIFGEFKGTGEIVHGTGFTVTRKSAGVYKVTYTTAFASFSIPVFSAYNHFPPLIPVLISASTTAFECETETTGGETVDEKITFHVMGI